MQFIFPLLILSVFGWSVSRSKNKISRVIFDILIFSITLFFVSIILQLLHLFTYEIFVSTYFIILLIVLYLTRKLYCDECEEKNFYRAVFIFLLTVVVSYFYIGQVHFNYSGVVTTSVGNYLTENMQSKMPYYSDEWVTVGFVKEISELNKPPFFNPYTEKDETVIMAPYFSFMAGSFLISSFDPIFEFAHFHLLWVLLFVTTFFFTLRKIGVSDYMSSISTIGLFYILNGTNIPGLWFLMPFWVSFIFLMVSIYFLYENRFAIYIVLFYILQ